MLCKEKYFFFLNTSLHIFLLLSGDDGDGLVDTRVGTIHLDLMISHGYEISDTDVLRSTSN